MSVMCLCSYNQFPTRCICLKKSRGFLAADRYFDDAVYDGHEWMCVGFGTLRVHIILLSFFGSSGCTWLNLSKMIIIWLLASSISRGRKCSLQTPRQHSMMLATGQTQQSLSARFDQMEAELQVPQDPQSHCMQDASAFC